MANLHTRGGGVFLLHQLVTTTTPAAVIVGESIDVTKEFMVWILMYVGRITEQASTNGSTWLIQVSNSTSGNEWHTIRKLSHNVITSSQRIQFNAATSAGDDTITVSDTTVGGDVHYIEDGDEVQNGEWRDATSTVTDTSITWREVMAFAHSDQSYVQGGGTCNEIIVDVSYISRIRVLFFHNETTTSDLHIKAVGSVVTQTV